MAYYYPEPSHTFSEYLLIPGYTSEDCIPDRVSLRTPLVKYRKGVEESAIILFSLFGYSMVECRIISYSC